MVTTERPTKQLPLCRMAKSALLAPPGNGNTMHATCAGALHLCEELLLDGVHQLRAEITRVEHDLMVQGDVVEHRPAYSCKICNRLGRLKSKFSQEGEGEGAAIRPDQVLLALIVLRSL